MDNKPVVAVLFFLLIFPVASAGFFDFLIPRPKVFMLPMFTSCSDNNFETIGVSKSVFIDENLYVDTIISRQQINQIEVDLNVVNDGNFQGNVKIDGTLFVNNAFILGDTNFSTIGISGGIFAKDGSYEMYWNNNKGSFGAGDNVFATGWSSTAFGFETIASGTYSTAFGRQTEAGGSYSVAFGQDTFSREENAFSSGYQSIAWSPASTAMGYQALATDTGAFAVGYGVGASRIKASGDGAIAMGYADSNTLASGKGSVALGYNVTSLGEASITLGKNLTNYNPNSVLMQDLNVLGDMNVSGTTFLENLSVTGDFNVQSIEVSGVSFNEGGIIASGDSNFSSHVKIDGNLFTGNLIAGPTYLDLYDSIGAHRFQVNLKDGYVNMEDTTQPNTISGLSYAFGVNLISTGGFGSLATGDTSKATGQASTALGEINTASGTGSFAVGDHSNAAGYASAAIGNTCSALVDNSVAIGYYATNYDKFTVALARDVNVQRNLYIGGDLNVQGSTKDDSLKAWYRLDEDVGDYSGNGYDATKVGGMLVTDGVAVMQTQTRYMDVDAYATEFANLDEGTIGFWFNITRVSEDQPFIAFRDKSEANSYLLIGLEWGDEKIHVDVIEAGGAILEWTSTATYDEMGWGYMIYSSDSTGNSIEINGVPDAGAYATGNAGTQAFVANVNDVDGFKIGYNEMTATGNYAEMDDIIVYSRRITFAERLRLYERDAKNAYFNTLRTGITGVNISPNASRWINIYENNQDATVPKEGVYISLLDNATDANGVHVRIRAPRTGIGVLSELTESGATLGYAFKATQPSTNYASTEYGYYSNMKTGGGGTPWNLYMDSSADNWLGWDNADNWYGSARDARIYYSGSKFVLDPDVVGSGPVNVSGDLEVDGDMSGSLHYAESWASYPDGVNLNFAASNTWYLFDLSQNTTMNGFHNTDGNFVVDKAGLYEVVYSASGAGQNNHTYIAGIAINDVNQANALSLKKLTAGGDVTTMNGVGFVNLSLNDVVSLIIMDRFGNGAGTVYHYNFTIKRVGN